ncbi:MAG: class I mannose-6-phosphate isomerase [Lachnospiraceae bacterium]|nr:class I mannose-6-phosphate isomerase [Lachnospiraceae bacterium]
MRLQPAYKGFLWGGSKLKKEYGNEKYPGHVLAETWELSCHEEGLTKIATGAYKGKTFKEYIETEGSRVTGTNCERYDKFPIIIKFIDAHQNHSVKVHPSHEYAQTHGASWGKEECWYILEALPNAGIYYGLNRDITKEELADRIRDNTLKEVLRFVPVHPGEIYLINPGTLHAIGAGVLAAEIQRDSDISFRAYDFGRVAPDGNPRPLHIKEATETASLSASLPELDFGNNLVHCECFNINRLECSGEMTLNTNGSSFHSLLFIDGDGIITNAEGRQEFQKGDSFFVSADNGEYKLKGNGKAILTTIPRKIQ